MPLIQCTKKLLSEINFSDKIVHSQKKVFPVLGNWHANLILVQRRKCVLFTNDETLFSLFISRLKKQDFKNLESIFIKNLILCLSLDNLGQYIDKIENEYSSSICFTKSRNRSILGSMNDMVHIIHAHLDGMDIDNIDDHSLNKILNRTPFKTNKYRYATECIRDQLENACSMSDLEITVVSKK